MCTFYAAPAYLAYFPDDISILTDDDLPSLLPRPNLAGKTFNNQLPITDLPTFCSNCESLAALSASVADLLSTPPKESERLTDFAAFETSSTHGVVSKFLTTQRNAFQVRLLAHASIEVLCAELSASKL